MRVRRNLYRLEPALPRSWLFGLSGFVWSGVGSMMVVLGASWLVAANAPKLGVAGLAVATLVYWLGFSRLARRNIARLAAKRARLCIFAFQTWRSYITVAVMVGLGLLLRHSSLPRPLLGIVYIGIGGGLLAASFLYYRELVRGQAAS